jgi:hypothetical protein
MTSPDLVLADRWRLAKYTADRFDEVKDLGAVPVEHSGFDPVPAHLFPGQDEVADLGLADLITV